MGCGSTKAATDDEKNAVENWRQKREQKRSKNVNTDNEEISISPFKIEPIRRKPIHSVPSPPIEKIKSKSPSPMRFKGPAKIHEIYIEKPIEIRGFGFKLDGGRSQNRPIIISAIEEDSPADKAGLCIDDEVISMNNENIENLTFDQVRKILKERNLRGSIKMIVKTYEDTIDDNSQTVTNGFPTDHSRTPSPPKHISTTTISPNIPVPKTNSTPNNLSPVYTFLPYTPSDSIKVNTVQQPIPTSPINILAPKPYRSTASINLDPQNNHDSNMKYTSPIEAFRRMLNSSNINKHTVNETPVPNEKQQINLSKQPPPRVITNTPLTIVEQFPPPPPPPTLSSVQSVLYGNSTVDNNIKQQRDESPIAQVRSYVEKQMDQLQQDLEFGFSRAPKIHSPSSPTLPRTPTLARDQQRPVNIPVDYTNPSISLSPPPPLQQQQQNQQPEFLRSSLKKSLSTQNEFEQIPTNRTYGLKINPNEQVIHYLDPYPQQVSSVNFTKRSIPDLPSMTTIHRPSTAHSLERTVNELRIELPGSYSSQPQRKTPNGHSNGRRSAPLAPHQQELQINRQPMSNYHDHHSRYEQQRNFESSPNKPNRTRSAGRTLNNERVLSVSGKLHCSRCNEELGHGSAMVIESLKLYYHIECFRCFVCNVPLTSSPEGIDVRIRNNRLHCQNCFSDENGVKLSAV
ncbi:unnamed protein product [Adineta steineri]|uniref:Uncharacterized protein n=1 Tax=Adineta steineri TaxID=433720 RepID=A0A815SCF6_9BILA|nr:unnamed protein product [Adineta steineri]CAF1640321.1 unnamed protein product [Adineta steineri]